MKKTMSLKQLAANRRNALQSTGPKTVNGKAVSKLNALKHGILSTQVLVRGRHGRENAREFTALHQRFTQELRPVGPLEEMLVDQVVTAHWRLRRALVAEAGEVALSVDQGEWRRRHWPSPGLQVMVWRAQFDMLGAMQQSSTGNRIVENWLLEARQAVERSGELREALVQSLVEKMGGKPDPTTTELQRLCRRRVENPEGLDADTLRERSKQDALRVLDSAIRLLAWQRKECLQHEADEEAAHQAAAVLPAMETLEKILRYETKLERQLFRAMNQLERLQRMRQGEAIPAPLTMAVTGKEAE